MPVKNRFSNAIICQTSAKPLKLGPEVQAPKAGRARSCSAHVSHRESLGQSSGLDPALPAAAVCLSVSLLVLLLPSLSE